MEIKDIRKWDDLTLREKSDVMRTAVSKGMYRLDEIRKAYNEYAEGGAMPDTVGEYADAIYQNATEEPYGDPSSHYNNVDTALMQRLVPDARGHYDDMVKLPNHPSSPSRGTFNGKYFDLTDEGMDNPNYTLFGLIDNGDTGTTLRYNGDYVLPEVTVTPEGNYYDDTYNNIKIMPWDSKIISQPTQYSDGGYLYKRGGKVSQRNQRAGYAVDYFINKGLSREQAAGLVGNLMRESSMNTEAVNPASGAYGLGQWLGERKTKLFKKYGKHPTFYNQLDYIWDELNSTHKKGLKMLKASKTVDDAARNAFGYYEFSAGPEAAVAAMNKNGKNTKWKNPNGTVALNDGISNAWVAYGKASPKAKLSLNLGNVPTLGYQRTIPQFDFEGLGDEIADIGYNQPSTFNADDALSQGLIPPNPTDYGTPVDYSSIIRKSVTQEDAAPERDNGIGLFSLMRNLDVFGKQQEQPLADYKPQQKSPFVVSAPTYNDTLLDDSWFAEGGPLYDDNQQVIPTDNTYVAPPAFPIVIKPELTEEAALKRANRVYSNYSDAVDNPLSPTQEAMYNGLRYLKDNVWEGIPSGVSNCTLTATQWVNPAMPIKNASSIVHNPSKYGYIQIGADYAIPGNLIIARNPENNAYHTMMISGFAKKNGKYNFDGKEYSYKKGEPLVTYSRGGNDASFIRRNIPLSVYTANSDGKTENLFYRYNYPNEIFLPEVQVVTKRHK